MPFGLFLQLHHSAPSRKRKVVGVAIEVRSHGNAERARHRYRKSWLLKNVIITLVSHWLLTHPRPRLHLPDTMCNIHARSDADHRFLV